MAKKIAILVRERQGEALRMAVGMILLDDLIDVYVLDRKVDAGEGENELYLETLKDLEMNTWSNCRENSGMEFLDNAGIARRLAEYDLVLPY